MIVSRGFNYKKVRCIVSLMDKTNSVNDRLAVANVIGILGTDACRTSHIYRFSMS